MKIILILCGLILAGAVAWFFLDCGCPDRVGPPLQGLERAEIGRLLERPSDYFAKDVRIEGVISQQCPNCGCWFFLREKSGKEVKVEMGETGEYIPWRQGKKATVEGRLIRYGDGVEFVGTTVEFD